MRDSKHDGEESDASNVKRLIPQPDLPAQRRRRLGPNGGSTRTGGDPHSRAVESVAAEQTLKSFPSHVYISDLELRG